MRLHYVRSGRKTCFTISGKRAFTLCINETSSRTIGRNTEGITLNAPATPVLNNVDVKAETESAEIRTALIRQLYSPVRWTETVEKMAQDGVEVLVEIGPGKVLNGLTKRIVAELQATSVNDVASLNAVEALLA